MRTLKPDYYDSFSCTGKDCQITCCQEWQITLDDGSIIPLDNDKKCPHLTCEGWCQLVIDLGEEALCHTCHMFPRQVHAYADLLEYSLVSCCPAVVDIWNKKEIVAYHIRDDKQAEDEYERSMVYSNSPLGVLRDAMQSFVLESSYSLHKTLKMLLFLILEIKDEKDILRETSLWKKKETLEELSNAMDQLATEKTDSFVERNELFLDLVENYRKEGLYCSYLTDITKRALSYEELEEENEAEVDNLQYEETFLETFKKYEKLMKHYIVAEIFTNVRKPQSTLSDMKVMTQWMIMGYVVMEHAIYLAYKENKDKLTYEMVRDYIVIISRMTGYEEEDIYEYMENSFCEIIWQWGYGNLIIGE